MQVTQYSSVSLIIGKGSEIRTCQCAQTHFSAWLRKGIVSQESCLDTKATSGCHLQRAARSRDTLQRSIHTLPRRQARRGRRETFHFTRLHTRCVLPRSPFVITLFYELREECCSVCTTRGSSLDTCTGIPHFQVALTEITEYVFLEVLLGTKVQPESLCSDRACVCVCLCLADCDKLRKDGFRSSQYYSQGPTFSGSGHSRNSQLEDEDEDDVDDKVRRCGSCKHRQL